MMQILEAAGVPVMTDERRGPDESNAQGYFEWEEIKQLPKNPFVIEKAEGKAVKIVSMLLPSLPRKHRFRVIFMQRPIEEVAASQGKLRERLAGTAAADPARMVEHLGEHRDRIMTLLQQSPNVDLLEVDYTDLLQNPVPQLERIADFSRIESDKVGLMRAVINPELRHFHGALVDQVSAES